jgi:Domain of unknown function (DUF5753)
MRIHNRKIFLTLPEQVRLRVVLFGAGAHQAMGFPFQIFEFAADDPPLVSVELLNLVKEYGQLTYAAFSARSQRRCSCA